MQEITTDCPSNQSHHSNLDFDEIFKVLRRLFNVELGGHIFIQETFSSASILSCLVVPMKEFPQLQITAFKPRSSLHKAQNMWSFLVRKSIFCNRYRVILRHAFADV